jgi:hypothetical protein
MALPKSEVHPCELRYIDFIASMDRSSLLLSEVEAAIGVKIVGLAPPPDQSGPKLGEAVATFARDAADFGRI